MNTLLSVDTQALVKHLQSANAGDVIEYKALSEIIGRDILLPRNRGLLISAMRVLQRQQDILFGTVRKVGVKRLHPEEIVGLGKTAVQHIRRHSRRTMRRLSCAPISALTEPQKVELLTHNSILGALNLMAKPTAIAKLTGAVQQAQSELPMAKTLALFQS